MLRRLNLVILAALISVGLTSCSLASQPVPDNILAGLYSALSQLQTARYEMTLDLRGGLTTSLSSNIDTAKIHLAGNLINRPGQLPHYSVDAQVSATGSDGAIQVGGNLINLDNYTYFQLTELVLPTLLPVSLGADKRWYKIPTEPNSANRLGGSKNISLTPAEEDMVRSLIANAKLLTVKEVLPMTTVNGQRAYHYKTQINAAEVSHIVEGISAITDSTEPLPNLEYLSQYEPEIFVNTKDNQLLRLIVAGTYLHDGVPTAFDLKVDLSNHNTKIDLVPPSSSQSIETAKIFGLPKLPF